MSEPIWNDASCVIHANGITWLEVYMDQYVQGFDVFEVTLNPQLAQQLLDRLSMVQRLNDEHKDIVCVVFEDLYSNGRFWHGVSPSDDAPPEPLRLSSMGYLLPSGLTEWTRISVSPTGISWRARPKGSSAMLITEPLSRTQLEAILEKMQVDGYAA